MPHNIMREMRVLSASPWHTISIVPVILSPDPKVKETYKIGVAYIDDKWENLYTPTKIGLDKLMIAAGVVEIEAHSERIESRIWSARWSGEYEQPDGKIQPLSDGKEMDLSIGGTRWEKKREIELDKLLKKHGVKIGKFRVGQYGNYMNKATKKKVTDDDLISLLIDLPEEQHARFERIAEEKASRFVRQSAQFGLELAQTGARLRAVRSIMQIGQYTAKQLEEPFECVRSQRDMERMREDLGPERLIKLLAAQSASAFGLDADETVKLLFSGPEKVELEDADEEPGTIEGIFEELEETVDEEVPEGLFYTPISEATSEWIVNHRQEAHIRGVNEMLGYIFSEPTTIEDLTEGQALNVKMFMTRLIAIGNKKEIADAKKDFAHIVRVCSEEERIWITKETGTQLELPSTMEEINE